MAGEIKRLYFADGVAVDSASATSMPSVTTTRGDLIRRGASIDERFAAVTDNRVVRGDGTDVILGQIDDTEFFTSGAYATGSAAGTLPVVSSMSDVLATQLGYKSYAHGTTYNGAIEPTVTLTGGGGTLTTVDLSRFIPYQMQDGVWRLRFTLTVTLSSAARTAVQLTVAGVTVSSATTQSISGGSTAAAATVYRATAQTNSGAFLLNFTSATTTVHHLSGDVELASKPTWAY